MTLLRIRGGSGIGDNLYVQAIVREIHKEKNLEVCTDYPELFPYPVRFAPFSRLNIDILAHYSRRRRFTTNQWRDVQIESGVKAELKIDWQLKKHWDLPDEFVLVNGPRTPMKRTDGMFDSLMPDKLVFSKELEKIDLPKVYIGEEEPCYPVDFNLMGQTTVSDIVDLAYLSTELFGQVSFMVPLAECFDKKITCIWSSRGLKSDNWVISGITPSKIFAKPTSKAVFDEVY